MEEGFEGIVHFSHSADYAIRVLLCLVACPGCHHKLSDLASCSGVPKAYLAKIMVKLGKAGIVTSKRGQRGGYRLTEEPADISVLSIIQAVSGHHSEAATRLPEPLAEMINRLHDIAHDMVAQLTIGDLLDKKPADTFPPDSGNLSKNPIVPQPPNNPTRRTT